MENEKKDGIAWEILERKELTPEERKEELIKAGGDLFENVKEARRILIALTVWGISCFLPTIAMITNLEILNFLLYIPVVPIPFFIVLICLVAFILTLPLWLSEHYRVKMGGCEDEHHTVVLIKEGPFKIVRNPEYIAQILILVLTSIMLSPIIRFTVLTIFGDIWVYVGYYLLAREEEEFDIKKWGVEYRKYQKEVPRFNFILGIYKWSKRRNS